jgi:hypothetical protein
MGLDMYLEVRKYVSTNDWVTENGDFVKKEVPEGMAILETSGLGNLISDEHNYGVTVSATAVYWRKTNSIHQWFVDNCAKGVDECQPIYVSRKDLEDLRDLVKDVLIHRNKASVALPTASGFFFGSTEYDEWYWSDLEYTAKELDRVLIQTFGDEGVSFIYQASW